MTGQCFPALYVGHLADLKTPRNYHYDADNNLDDQLFPPDLYDDGRRSRQRNRHLRHLGLQAGLSVFGVRAFRIDVQPYFRDHPAYFATIHDGPFAKGGRVE